MWTNNCQWLCLEYLICTGNRVLYVRTVAVELNQFLHLDKGALLKQFRIRVTGNTHTLNVSISFGSAWEDTTWEKVHSFQYLLSTQPNWFWGVCYIDKINTHTQNSQQQSSKRAVFQFTQLIFMQERGFNCMNLILNEPHNYQLPSLYLWKSHHSQCAWLSLWQPFGSQLRLWRWSPQPAGSSPSWQLFLRTQGHAVWGIHE